MKMFTIKPGTKKAYLPINTDLLLLYKPITMQEVTKIHALLFEPIVLQGPCSLNHSRVFIINVLL